MENQAKKFYVIMIDRFMSGWGKADGKKNRLIIECDSLSVAEGIALAAKNRDEMKNIRVSELLPQSSPRQYIVSTKKAEVDLWGPWYEYLPCDKDFRVLCRKHGSIGAFEWKVFRASFERHAACLASLAGYEYNAVEGVK